MKKRLTEEGVARLKPPAIAAKCRHGNADRRRRTRSRPPGAARARLKSPTAMQSRAVFDDSIPDPHARGATEVSFHNIRVGTVVAHNGSFFSFDHRGTLLGEFADRVAAMRAFRKIEFDEVGL